MGELGEAANVSKKMLRDEQGIVGNKESLDELRQRFAEELADAVTYIDLLAQLEGIALESALIEKFNTVSSRIDYPERLPVFFESIRQD